MPAIQNIAQSRAQCAFKFAEEGKKKGNYKSYVKKFPALIHTNGLSYALAFAFSKYNDKDEGWKFLYIHIENWLKTVPNDILDTDWLAMKIRHPNHKSELIKLVLKMDTETLMWTTQEVMILFDWLKRFVGDD